MNADDRYDEFLLSDHPAAAAERTRRGVTDPRQVAGLRDEWVAFVRDWEHDTYTYPTRLLGDQAATQPAVPDPGLPAGMASERRARQRTAEQQDQTLRAAAGNGQPLHVTRRAARRAWDELAAFEDAPLVRLRTNPRQRRQRSEEAGALSPRVQTGLELENDGGPVQRRAQIWGRGYDAEIARHTRGREGRDERER